MYKGLFITGTDTGVGKTYISSAIARAAKQYGFSVGVMKPLSSGDRDDARALIDAAGVSDPLDRVNPVFFKYPLSPLASAELEGKRRSRSVRSGAPTRN
jgi:Dethiobiotin synthetase